MHQAPALRKFVANRKFALAFLAFLISIVAGHLLIASRPYAVGEAELRSAYSYTAPTDIAMQMQQLSDRSWSFTFKSFDGAKVNGRMHYPQTPDTVSSPLPVMLGAHGMGRSEIRWWQDSFKGRPTVEQVHMLSKLALDHGHVVITIDARYHGHRKDPQKPLASIMNDLHYFGSRTDYENMIRQTVLDHRVLLDWINQNPELDRARIKVAGYSMGAQIALLLAGVDSRVHSVLAIAPPHISNRTAIVAPQNVISGLRDKHIWLLSANDDEYASSRQNDALFSAFPTEDKRHLVFDGGHILPEGYVADLASWF